MRELNLAVEEGSAPKYLRLAEAIRQAIEGGQLRPGELVPSTRQLGERYETHRHTVMNALAELVSEGWLESEPGRGYRVVAGLPRYFVCDPPPAAPPGAPSRDRYAFPSGQPDLRLFPTEEYYATLREVLRHTDPVALLDYDEPAGARDLLVQLSHYLRRLRDINSTEIVVTHGSQEGIFLVSKMLVRPGDVVAVDEIGYSPAWEALRLVGARLVGLPVDRSGVVPEALAQLARQTRVGLLYTTPLHQYPSTVTMPQERRRELYQVCSDHGIPILEDDYDHEFHYRSRPLAPLKSRDPEQLVYYISTFSKVVYPSARIGFAVVPPGQACRLAGIKRVTTRQSSTLVQLTQARWMESGGFERHLRRMRRAYQTRLQVMARVLQEGADRYGLPVSFDIPDGGMSLWVDFGVDTARLAAQARTRGVAVRPGTEYRLDGGPSTHLRLGFASSTPQEIEEGLGILMQCASNLATAGP
jgi:GntR family transcriptional regulator/MocR family aminotransferase